MTFLVLKRAVLGKEQSILDGEKLVGLLHISLQLEMVTDMYFFFAIILFFYYKEKQKYQYNPHSSKLTLLQKISTNNQTNSFESTPQTCLGSRLKVVIQISKIYKQSQQQNLSGFRMSQKQQLSSTQKDESSYLDIDTQFDDYRLQQYDHQQEIDLEQSYVCRLKQQRKRIQQLSQLHQDNQDRLKRQIDKNKSMQEEISRLSIAKEYQIKYNELASNLQTTIHQNKILKEQITTLKQEIAQNNSDKLQTIQKLKYQLSLHKNKESATIQNLQQQLANKQDEYELLQRQSKNRQKQLLDTISSLKHKIDSIIQDYDLQLRAEQRKSQKLERDLQNRVSSMNELQNIGDSLLRENSQIKEELFKCSSLLQSKEQQLRCLSEKYKYKLSSIKKQNKNKDKQLVQQKQAIRRQQRQNKELICQIESVKGEIKKVFQSGQVERHRLQIDFNKQKQSLQIAINQHLATIEQLIGVKNELLAENKKYITIIRKKQAIQKQRKSLLRTQLKQLDKLQRVIDKIVQ